MRRRSAVKLRALLMIVAGAMAIAGIAPVAAAAATGPEVVWAHNTQDDYGFIEVYANAEAGIESLTAHVRSDTGEELATITSFTLSSGTNQNGVFRANTRVVLDKFDVYRIDVDAVDTLGQRTTAGSAGSLVYLIRPIFSALSYDHTTITRTRRTVKVKGTLSGKWPTDGLLRPVSKLPLQITASFETPVEVLTGVDGRFTGVVTLDHEATVSAYFNPRKDYDFIESESQQISVQPDPTRFTLKVSPSKVKLGEAVTVTGQLTWRSPDGWKPLANRKFGLLECDQQGYCPNSAIETPATDSEGRFSVTHVPEFTGYYQVAYSGDDENGQPDMFMAKVLTKASVSVLQPAEFSDFTAARDESGQVVSSGHLVFNGRYSPGITPVKIQYRAPGTSSSWSTVAEVYADWDGSGHGFSATVDQPAGGHWRAYYPGQEDWFQTAVSAKVQVGPAAP